MITVEKKNDCCGCTACGSICPKKCIEFMPDIEGFLYPKVNMDACINCGLCESVCPMNNKKKPIDIKKGVVLRDKNEYIAKESSSGGFFTSFANHIIKKGGVIYAVACEAKVIKHVRVTNLDGVDSLRGSKYVQSEIRGIFNTIAQDLQNNRLVGFVGTSCQLNGLINYLNIRKIDKSNLITVDLICHGVSSPLLWDKYIKYQEEKFNSEIDYVNFRYKTYGYHSGSMKLHFKNGKNYYGSGRVDFMLKSFFSEISSRPSCFYCNFKDSNRLSDFTVFDAWHYYELTGRKDDDRGYTNVLINTEKGLNYFENIKNYYHYEYVDFSEAIRLDGIMYDKSAIPHQQRDEFYFNTINDTMNVIANKYLNIKRKDWIIERMKSIYYYKKKIK